jgi:hypothetical protein
MKNALLEAMRPGKSEVREALRDLEEFHKEARGGCYGCVILRPEHRSLLSKVELQRYWPLIQNWLGEAWSRKPGNLLLCLACDHGFAEGEEPWAFCITSPFPLNEVKEVVGKHAMVTGVCKECSRKTDEELQAILYQGLKKIGMVDREIDIKEAQVMYAEKKEKEIFTQAKALGRTCGTCSLCCKLVPVKEDDWEKPAGKWCEHCVTGKGCGIYATRPMACRSWSCQWLVNPLFGDHWFPAKAKMVVSWVPDLLGNKGGNQYEVLVDPGFPNRWREEPWHSDLREIASAGFGMAQAEFRVMVRAADRSWMVLPDRDVETTDMNGASVVIKTAGSEGDAYRMFQCESPDHAKQLLEGLSMLSAMLAPEELLAQVDKLGERNV